MRQYTIFKEDCDEEKYIIFEQAKEEAFKNGFYSALSIFIFIILIFLINI